MFKLAPGDQDQRILGIGQFISKPKRGGHEARTPVFSRKMIGEHHRLAGVVVARARIDHRTLTLETRPADACERGHTAAHFLEHLSRMRVVPGQPQPLRKIHNDRKILPRLPRGGKRCAPELDQPVGIGKRAGLFGMRRGGQDHVCEPRGFGRENILDHQKFERRQRLARMRQIGV